MNTKILLLGAVVTAFAFTSFAAEPLLSPRAAGNQIKHVASSTETPTVINTTTALLSPRAVGNQIRTVQGLDTDLNPAQVCRNTMNGTPKLVAECSSHPTMPGCVAVAALK